MPPWKIKAAVQGVFSLLPQPQRWNRYLQTYVTRSLDLTDERFLNKWAHAERHARHADLIGGIARARVMELGTGWLPIVPTGLALAGAESVETLDLHNLLRRDDVIGVLEAYERLIGSGAVDLPSPARSRLAAARAKAGAMTAEGLLEELLVKTRVGDSRVIPLPDGSIDLFVSNNVLEHIPRDVLVDIFREFRRLASPNAVMSHYIDLADHYAGFDRSISAYNFLRYSEREWRWFNNALHYQNRLRASDYRAIHKEAAWTVVDEELQREASDALRRIPLAPEFRRYSEDDLLVYGCWMVSKPAQGLSTSSSPAR